MCVFFPDVSNSWKRGPAWISLLSPSLPPAPFCFKNYCIKRQCWLERPGLPHSEILCHFSALHREMTLCWFCFVITLWGTGVWLSSFRRLLALLAPLLHPSQGLQPKEIKTQRTDQSKREGEKDRAFLPQWGSCSYVRAEHSLIDSSAIRVKKGVLYSRCEPKAENVPEVVVQNQVGVVYFSFLPPFSLDS